ncbi:hypothetical protein CDAR_468721 [Caerostris darwini]|uniref:Uncharacterized protein n=1 Tax=Caerostris darwini TaxID=1538125 RepID=A0AAV4T8F9_9ARAC|nr:hypothetical protein CDAR_468721 [Caerostris darwini]
MLQAVGNVLKCSTFVEGKKLFLRFAHRYSDAGTSMVSGNASSGGKRFEVQYFYGRKKLFLRYFVAGAAMVHRGSWMPRKIQVGRTDLIKLVRYLEMLQAVGNVLKCGTFEEGKKLFLRFAHRYSEAGVAMVHGVLGCQGRFRSEE